MASLISKRSLDDFFRNMLIPLSLYGLGSVRELLDMKMFELKELKICMEAEDMQELYRNLHGLSLE